MFERGLFIFHRDFRIIDNVGLLEANEQCKQLYVCFIFTPEQVGKANHYRSQNAIQFMIESLADLSTQIKKAGGELLLFYGKQLNIISQCMKTFQIQCVFFNKDYTPYAIERDTSTVAFCKKRDIQCQMFSDYYLFEPGSVTTSSGDIYKKFTPFYDEVLPRKVNNPKSSFITNFSKPVSVSLEHTITLSQALSTFARSNTEIAVHGGRVKALEQLKSTLAQQARYDDMRDYFVHKTTFLSAYIKFGCVSVREVYHTYKRKYGIKHGLIRELIWRDFFAHILYGYPSVLEKSTHFEKIHWRQSKSDFERWMNGTTGFPAVDAGMRQMNTTGYMHNRCRMIVANFLVKTLLLDWRLGETYFAQKLTDYDIASNNGNWGSIASVGVYFTPYFRDMSPWIQSKKFDKNAEYIKHWVPELCDVDARDIHRWNEAFVNYTGIDYPRPMVDYADQKKKMLEMYSNKS